jgi:hypothetical protein
VISPIAKIYGSLVRTCVSVDMKPCSPTISRLASAENSSKDGDPRELTPARLFSLGKDLRHDWQLQLAVLGIET